MEAVIRTSEEESLSREFHSSTVSASSIVNITIITFIILKV